MPFYTPNKDLPIRFFPAEQQRIIKNFSKEEMEFFEYVFYHHRTSEDLEKYPNSEILRKKMEGQNIIIQEEWTGFYTVLDLAERILLNLHQSPKTIDELHEDFPQLSRYRLRSFLDGLLTELDLEIIIDRDKYPIDYKWKVREIKPEQIDFISRLKKGEEVYLAINYDYA